MPKISRAVEHYMMIPKIILFYEQQQYEEM